MEIRRVPIEKFITLCTCTWSISPAINFLFVTASTKQILILLDTIYISILRFTLKTLIELKVRG